jgi:nucleoside-diphosphate-sugar epimerase
MRQILVTGGAGFIGANLCKKLLDKGYVVLAVDNLITSDGSNVKSLLKNSNFEFFKHDITKPFPKNLNSKLSAISLVFHLACPTGVSNLVKLAEEMLLTCSTGTLNVLNFSKKNNAKVIFTSSSEAYGDPQVFPQKEEYNGNVNPVGIRSPYEEGKRFSESLIMGFVRKYGLDARIVRVFNTYGPGMSKTESRVVARFLRAARSNKALPVEGKGVQTRTFCYVDDLVEGLILIEEKGEKGEVYNLGSDEEITIKNLANKIIKLTNSKSKTGLVPRPSHDHNGRRPDLTKIKKLGWKKNLNLDEGLIKTNESIKNGL